jgi:hypothetical protein
MPAVKGLPRQRRPATRGTTVKPSAGVEEHAEMPRLWRPARPLVVDFWPFHARPARPPEGASMGTVDRTAFGAADSNVEAVGWR